MANPAQDEADQLFSQRDLYRSHPEDRDKSDEDSLNEKQDNSEPAFTSNPNDDTDDDDLDISTRMSSLTATKSHYTIPSTEYYSNTGPKGVISDAQSFSRAKRTASKYKPPQSANGSTDHTEEKPQSTIRSRKKTAGSDTDDDIDPEDDDDLANEADETFMNQWRTTRLAELSAKSDSARQQQQHNARLRTYGSVTPVDETAYLDAVEQSPPSTVVVVLLHDPTSQQSLSVADELDILAYKYGHVRFVKMDHTLAEMNYVGIPALLCYRDGDVFATISGAKRNGLEAVLVQQDVLG